MTPNFDFLGDCECDLTIDSSEAYEKPYEEPSSATETSKITFKVKKWDAVALWAWDLVTDNCSICRNQILGLCIECQALESQESKQECPVAWGSCNHAFHFHCISGWLKSRTACPLDNKVWKYENIGQALKDKGTQYPPT
ncbi:RING-box protein 1-like [Drosophila serrata]|uniref:RING-box protein 1-like n=1 Tax=Drosophila serrata TaxID=7274 RepID=UPI000A1D118A|nr:RING-box protein 1-like [Drosophila serrata]